MTPAKNQKSRSWQQQLLAELDNGVAWDASAHEDHRGRPYTITVHWSADGRMRPVSVTVQAVDGVDSILWRDVTIGSALDRSHAGVVKLWEGHAGRADLSDDDRRKVLDTLAAARPLSSDPAVMEQVAETYLKAQADGRRPTRAVEEALNDAGHDVTRQAAAKLVMKCRKLGLIPPAR